MIRYTIGTIPAHPFPLIGLVEQFGGEYVKYSDHAVECHRLTRELDESRNERDYMDSLLTRAHRLIPLTDPLWAEIHTVINHGCPPSPTADLPPSGGQVEHVVGRTSLPEQDHV